MSYGRYDSQNWLEDREFHEEGYFCLSYTSCVLSQIIKTMGKEGRKKGGGGGSSNSSGTMRGEDGPSGKKHIIGSSISYVKQTPAFLQKMLPKGEPTVQTKVRISIIFVSNYCF